MSAAFWNGILADHAKGAAIAAGVSNSVTPADMWTHRGWKISVDTFVWSAAHPDYDGLNDLAVSAETYKELLAEIDMAQDDYDDANGQFGVGA